MYLRAECKECRAGYEKLRRSTDNYAKRKHLIRAKALKRLYGITVEQYNDLFEVQQGKCVGCGRHQVEFSKSLVVDHCHTTGKIRGLLCAGCNIALGNVKENTNTLLSLAHYLDRTTK